MGNVSLVLAARLAILLTLTLAACRPAIHNDQSRVFAEDVLRTIAAQQVEERISQARALLAQINLAKDQLAAGQPATTPDTHSQVNRVKALVELKADDVKDRDLLESFADLKVRKPLGARRAAYQEVLAWLDLRRRPLQDELVHHLLEKTVTTDKGFLVCVDGVRREYAAVSGGRFSRQPDKPGRC